MEKNRVEGLATLNVTSKPVKKSASQEVVLAAQLHQARETIIGLRRTLAEQEQVIAQLQATNFNLEAQRLEAENATLREKFGLKSGQRLEQDGAGGWVIVEDAPQD